MSDWIHFRPFSIHRGFTATFAGEPVQAYLAPYDVPEAVRGILNESGNAIKIQFRYPGQDSPAESLNERDANQYVMLRTGDRSGRLHEIEIDLASLLSGESTIEELKIAVGSAIEGLAVGVQCREAEHLRTAREAFDAEANELFEPIGAI